MTRTGFYGRKDKPHNYYRTGIATNDFRLAMEGTGWLTVTQLVGMMSDKIPPEAKSRYMELHNGRKPIDFSVPIEVRISAGCRDLIRTRLQNLIWRKKVEKHGRGKDATYRWIESEVRPAKKDKA